MPPISPPERLRDADIVTVPAELARAMVRLAAARTQAEIHEALELASRHLPSRAILVVYESLSDGGDSGRYQIIARSGGPLGVPTRIPWGGWGPADQARRAGAPAITRMGPHPFGPSMEARIGGPASRPPGEGLGLAVLAAPHGGLTPRQEVVEILAEAAAAGLHRSAQFQDLARRSLRDPLTGVMNRKAMEEILVREFKRASRPNNVKQTSLIMLDLDGFKEINDRHGHHAGDLLLRGVAEAMSRVLRAEDVVARYGGDEFVVLLPETDGPGALKVARKIRSAVSRLRVQSVGRSLEVQASLGVGTDPGEPATFDRVPSEADKRALARRFAERIRRLLTSADNALYAAKAAGRNAVRHSDPDIDAELVSPPDRI